MRRIALLVSVLAACSGTEPDSDDTDAIDTDTDTSEPGHPLVPEEYRYLWNTSACTNSQGDEGAQVYVLGSGSIDGEKSVAIEERWYWFYGEPEWEGDCVDTFTITGGPGPIGAIFGCGECDEKYAVERVLTDRTCSMNYEGLLGEDVGGSEPAYEALLLIDSRDASDAPHPDDEIAVYNAPRESGGEYATDPDPWGTGHIEREGDAWPPATYTWMHDLCVVVSSGP